MTIGVWSDPNGDGTPDDAALLGSVVGAVQNSNTNTFVTYCFDPPVALPAGATSFFVGNATPNFAPELLQQGIDETISQRRSWVSGNADGSPVNFVHPGRNSLVDLIDNFGLPGNWLIRADDMTCDESLSLVGAASIRNGFRIALPLTGTAGIEDRLGAPTGRYRVIMTFNHRVGSVGGATATCGTVGQASIDQIDPHNVIIPLTSASDACNATYITVSATNVMDETGHVLAQADVTMGLLIGDVTANGIVDQQDLAAIGAARSQTSSILNFRSDIDNSGVIDKNDYHKANRYLGTSLP